MNLSDMSIEHGKIMSRIKRMNSKIEINLNKNLNLNSSVIKKNNLKPITDSNLFLIQAQEERQKN
jgi:hypothetical protein